MKQLSFLVSLLFCLLWPHLSVVADQIILDEPPEGVVYHADGPLNIRYRGICTFAAQWIYHIVLSTTYPVRFNGMASLSSATVALAKKETGQIVESFPNATWNRGSDHNEPTVHQLWNIPRHMENGSYVLRIAGP